MKRSVMTLALVLAGGASAASFGGYIGSDAGLYYQTPTAGGDLRYGVNAIGIFSKSVVLAGEISTLRNFAQTTTPNNFGPLTPYYGAGLGAGFVLGTNGGGVSLYPHGLLGLRYTTTSPLSFFGEVNAGPRISLGGASGLNVGVGARIGANYNLR